MLLVAERAEMSWVGWWLIRLRLELLKELLRLQLVVVGHGGVELGLLGLYWELVKWLMFLTNLGQILALRRRRKIVVLDALVLKRRQAELGKGGRARCLSGVLHRLLGRGVMTSCGVDWFQISF